MNSSLETYLRNLRPNNMLIVKMIPKNHRDFCKLPGYFAVKVISAPAHHLEELDPILVGDTILVHNIHSVITDSQVRDHNSGAVFDSVITNELMNTERSMIRNREDLDEAARPIGPARDGFGDVTEADNSALLRTAATRLLDEEVDLFAYVYQGNVFAKVLHPADK